MLTSSEPDDRLDDGGRLEDARRAERDQPQRTSRRRCVRGISRETMVECVEALDQIARA